MSTAGLQDIVVGKTALSHIDGVRGVLSYCGYDIHDLTHGACFEEIVALLYDGELPGRARLDEVRAELGRGFHLSAETLALLRGAPRAANPMDVLRTMVSGLGMFDDDAAAVLPGSPEANRRRGLQLVARTASLVAAFDRLRRGEEPLQPAADLGYAANFLYMLSGTAPAPAAERALDMCLVLHADHGFNASTFAARVAASTLSDLYSAVVAAIGTLKGPLHGGANQKVMEMLLEIGEVENTEAYVRRALAEKRRIMGFGHRVYKTEDPRAQELQRISRDLGEQTGQRKFYGISERIREVVWAEKKLNVNVDFYSASVYYMLGIPPDLFTPIFAMSRMSGWTAHVLEQQADNRLIRPESNYVGASNRRFLPLAERG